MQELLDKIQALGPAYLRDAMSLIGGPKRFIAAKLHSGSDAFSDSLTFLCISLIICVTMISPGLASDQVLGFLSKALLRTFVEAVISGWSVWLAWRIVGGIAPASTYVIIYSYYTSVALLITGVIGALFLGVLKTFDENGMELALLLIRIRHFDLDDLSSVSLAYVALVAAWLLILAIWGIAGWGAYRQLNGASRVRSIVALIFTVSFGSLLMVLAYLIARGMA